MAFGGRIEAIIAVPAGVTVSATNGTGGPSTVTLTAGNYTATALVAHFVARLNADRPSGWTGSVSTGSAGTGYVSIAGTGTWSISWTSTTLRDALGFTANITAVTGTRTGTICARGLWMPDAVMQLDGDAARAPIVSDLRTTEGPTGNVYAMAGNTKYRHSNIRWSHVPRARVHETVAQYAGNTFETWMRQTQFGSIVPWIGPGAGFEIYDHNEVKLGSDYSVVSWKISPAITSIEPKRSGGSDWVGLYEIVFPTIVSAG